MQLSSRQFILSHLKTAITDECDYLFVGECKLGTNCTRQTETHGSGPTGADPVIGMSGFVELCSPHLMLADVSGDNRFTAGLPIYLVDNMLLGQTCSVIICQ